MLWLSKITILRPTGGRWNHFSSTFHTTHPNTPTTLLFFVPTVHRTAPSVSYFDLGTSFKEDSNVRWCWWLLRCVLMLMLLMLMLLMWCKTWWCGWWMRLAAALLFFGAIWNWFSNAGNPLFKIDGGHFCDSLQRPLCFWRHSIYRKRSKHAHWHVQCCKRHRSSTSASHLASCSHNS